MDTIIIKLSGKALGAERELSALFQAASASRLVAVHGGGVEVDALFKALALEVRKIDGLRVSPAEQMPYIIGALGGMCNRRLQALAVKNGLKAVGGLCSDGGSLTVRPLDPRLGMVGTVSPGDPAYLNCLLDHGCVPVLASLAIDGQGAVYNVNADEAARALARLLRAPLYFISDVPGVLDERGELIERLDAARAAELIARGVITEGMAVKVRNALKAASEIGRPVYIASYKDPDLGSALAGRRRLGTAFTAFTA